MTDPRSTARRGLAAAAWMAASIGTIPVIAFAAGSPGYSTHPKSVRDLIIDGNRPELSACLYAAQRAVTAGTEYSRLRWSDDAALHGVVRDYQVPSARVRETRFLAQALQHSKSMFSLGQWVAVEVSCRQVDERAPEALIRPSTDAPAK